MKFERRSSGTQPPIGVGEAHSLKAPFSSRERGFGGMGDDNSFD